MARYLIDTNIFTFVATKDFDSLSADVRSILDDYDNEMLMSIESVRELIVAYRNKKVISKYFNSPIELVDSIVHDYNIRIVQVDMEVMRVMATLQLNEREDHKDPSDHIIISQAISMRLPLISSDRKFEFYRKQGLDLIFNRK